MGVGVFACVNAMRFAALTSVVFSYVGMSDRGTVAVVSSPRGLFGRNTEDARIPSMLSYSRESGPGKN